LNKIITCLDCGQDFDFTPEEQEFFNQKGFDDPKRCLRCRIVRRENKFGSQEQKPKYQPSTRKCFDRTAQPNNFQRGYQTSFQMKKSKAIRVETTCTLCGAHTVVPFEPAPNRAVYCRACLSMKPEKQAYS